MANASPILILSSYYNRPDFIELQHKTFQRFLKDPYIFIIFNDASDSQLRAAISRECARFNIECIDVPFSIHNNNFSKRYLGEPLTFENRAIQAMQFGLSLKGLVYDGLVMYIDSDMFLVKDLSVQEFLKGFDLAGVYECQDSICYINPSLVFFNMSQLPDKKNINFFPERIGDMVVSGGGSMYKYFKKNSEVKLKSIDHILSINLDLCVNSFCLQANNLCSHNLELFRTYGFNVDQIEFLENHPRNIEFLCNNSFLHYRNGSNWDPKSEHYRANKTMQIRLYIENILNKK